MSTKYQCQNCGSVRELNDVLKFVMARNGFLPVNVEEPKPEVKKPVKPAKPAEPEPEEEEDLRLED